MSISLQRIRISAFVATLAIAFFSAQNVFAAEYTVNSTIDSNTISANTCVGASDTCSLRQAVMLANNNAGHDTIFLPAGEFAFDLSLTTTGTDASIDDLNITDDLTIVHIGTDTATIDANASTSDPSRIFSVENGATVSFSNMTLTGGYQNSLNGGAVYVEEDADVTFDTVTIEGNRANNGGGVYSFGSITMQNSIIRNNTADHSAGMFLFLENNNLVTLDTVLISDNTATREGGGMSIEGSDASGASGELHITNTTITNNTAADAGGIDLLLEDDIVVTLDSVLISDNTVNSEGGGMLIDGYSESGELHITNTTITNNTAGMGGGIFLAPYDLGYIFMYHSTIADNTAQTNGGGLYVDGVFSDSSSNIELQGNIIAGNDSVLNVGEDCFVDEDEHILSEGYNVISDTSGCNESDFVATDELNVDPEFVTGVAADNGGPVQTIALAASSPAVNIVPEGECVNALGEALTEDARGEARDSRCDAGAYEYSDSAPTLTLTGDTVELTCEGTYAEPGYTATDDVDGTMTQSVVVDTSDINENENGTYTVNYTVSDAIGNTAVATRQVDVTGCTNRTILISDVSPITGVTPLSRGRVRVAYENGESSTFTVFETGNKKPRARLTTSGDRVVVVKGNGRTVRVIDGYTGELLAGKKVRNTKQRIVKMRVFDYYRNTDSTDEIVIATKRKNSTLMKVSVFTLHDSTDRLRKRSTKSFGVEATSSGSEYTVSKKKKRLRIRHDGELIFKARVKKNTKKLRVIPIIVPLAQ